VLHARAPQLDFVVDERGLVSATTSLMPCEVRAELEHGAALTPKSEPAVTAFLRALGAELGEAFGGRVLYLSVVPRRTGAAGDRLLVSPVSDPPRLYGGRLPTPLSDDALLARWASACATFEWVGIHRSQHVLERSGGNPCAGAQVPCDPPGPDVEQVVSREVVGSRPVSRRFVASVVKQVVEVCTEKGFEVRAIAGLEVDSGALRTELFGSAPPPYESDITLTQPGGQGTREALQLRDAVTGEPLTDPVFANVTPLQLVSLRCVTMTPQLPACARCR
jgi:hypothetical protein